MTSSEGRSDNGAAGVEEIPPESKKMVETVKEIVNCSELEIYVALKESSMDPNEAVHRLLSQDPFHQVKSKRDKKKENKELPETKFRVGSSTSHRGSRSDRGRGGSAQYSFYDSSPLQGKLAYKKENGTNSLSIPQVPVDNPSWRPSAFSKCVTMENEMSKRSVDEEKSASHTNSGYQTAWVGVPSQKSLADVAKIGEPQSSAANTLKSSQSCAGECLDHVPKSTEFHEEFSSSENQINKVTDQYEKQGGAPDEWPLFEPPESTNSSLVLDSHAGSQLHPVRSDLPYDKTTQHLHSENDEFKEEEEESCKNRNDYHVGIVTDSDRTRGVKSGNASLYGNGMYTMLGPYQNHSCQNEEVKDGVATSVLSETANLQHLSIQEEERKPSYEEDGPSVVIPDHLLVQSADCEYMSFGSFRSSVPIGFFQSVSSRNNMEETPIVSDASVIRKTDIRKAEYFGEDAFLTAADDILAYRASGVAGTFDSASASQRDFLKQYPEATAHGSQYNYTTDSADYPFQNAQRQNIAFSHGQTSSWMQNHASFSNAMVHTDSLSSTILAENVPVRDSQLSYSPFPVAQSVAAKYGNTVSSINSSSISLEEALKTGLQSLQITQQHLSGKHIASEPSDYQHLVAYQNFQPSHPLGPFANMSGYSYLPQNDSYMPSAFQQTFAGNGAYYQSQAAVLPQYKNSASVSSLPQSAAVPSGYGNFGDSTTITGHYAMNPSVVPAGSVPPQYKNSASVSSLPQSAAVPSGYGNYGDSATITGNYAMNPSAVPAGSTIGYDDLLSTRYRDNSYSSPLQQNENSAMWLHGHGSRTMPAVPASTYYSLQGQNQHTGGFGHSQQSSLNYGDTNFYNSRRGMPLDQQLESPKIGSLSGSYVQSNQPQIWQNSY